MSSQVSTISAMHHLKIAYEYMSDFQRSNPDSRGARVFNSYKNRIDQIFRDMITQRFFKPEIIEALRNEWNGDVFVVTSISEKLPELSPEQREVIETLIDAMIAGEEVLMEKSK